MFMAEATYFSLFQTAQTVSEPNKTSYWVDSQWSLSWK